MLNRVILIGRLTKEPELKYTPNGTAVATFTLAIDRMRKDANGDREADFINIVVWQKQAEHCATYLGKGSLVAIDGRIQVRNYEDKEGNKRYVTEVVAESVRFLDKKGDNSNKGTQKTNQSSNVEFTEDDIPFI